MNQTIRAIQALERAGFSSEMVSALVEHLHMIPPTDPHRAAVATPSHVDEVKKELLSRVERLENTSISPMWGQMRFLMVMVLVAILGAGFIGAFGAAIVLKHRLPEQRTIAACNEDTVSSFHPITKQSTDTAEL